MITTDQDLNGEFNNHPEKRVCNKCLASGLNLDFQNEKKSNTWMAENCPADSVTLGKAAWTLLHTTAAYYPDRPAPSQMDSMRLFMNSFIDNYPCFKREFKEYMMEEPIRVGSRKKLSEWLCRQHNKVNEKLGKPSFDCSVVLDRWLQGSNKQCDQ